MTFSIAAYDSAENAWGVAVASKFLAVGAVVPFARAGQGAVATQSYANTTYGPTGLDMMASGLSARQVLAKLVTADTDRNLRQVGLVDAQGRAAAYTGSGCYSWAGHVIGPNFTCQGNILVGEDTVKAMSATFQSATGPFANRLLAALAAGEAAGGDSRGRQSAALLVVKPNGGYSGFNDRYIDLRVDDHPQPVQRLAELLELHHLFFDRSDPSQRIPIEGALVTEIQAMLLRQGLLTTPPTGIFDAETRRVFEAFIGRENLEDRVDIPAALIDPPALEYIRQRFGK